MWNRYLCKVMEPLPLTIGSLPFLQLLSSVSLNFVLCKQALQVSITIKTNDRIINPWYSIWRHMRNAFAW